MIPVHALVLPGGVWRASLCMICLIATTALRSMGQVFQLHGGASSLYQAQGGTLSVRGSGYTGSVGAGTVAGKFAGGANLTKVMGRSTWIMGDDFIHFVLPTDIFDASHYVVAQGLGVMTTWKSTGVFAFAGATSTVFDSPLFEGARAESPAFILFLDKRLAPGLALSSKMIFSRQTTAIEGLDWYPADRLKLGISGGIGANQPYGAASLDFRRKWITVQFAYIEAGSQFHRTVLEAPLQSEPDRENVLVTLKPLKYFSVSGGRQNFLTPLSVSSPVNVHSSIDQSTATLDIKGVGIQASLYHSTYLGNSNNSDAYSVGRELTRRVHASASYLESRPDNAPKARSFISNFSELLTPRWNLTEVITRSHGQTSVSFGGGFLSNLVSASAEYETYYVPQRNSAPFVQAMIVDLQINLFRGFSLHGGSFVAPDGSLRYTADASGIITREAASGGGSLQHYSIGNSVVRGRVVDTKGQPVDGAALLIDKAAIYTDSDGRFFFREPKPHTHTLQVLTEKFLNGGNFEVESAPSSVTATRDAQPPEILIVVKQGITPTQGGMESGEPGPGATKCR
jgi:Carboxypeptidase regulatory-like domain